MVGPVFVYSRDPSLLISRLNPAPVSIPTPLSIRIQVMVNEDPSRPVVGI